MDYTYRPLDHERCEIRLLSFNEPAICSDTLDLQLEHVAFDSNTNNWGNFAALSYVVGDPTPCRAILLNGRHFNVANNLFVALWQLRRIFFESSPGETHLPLWVDAVSISQSDITEKNRQIPRMRYIYGCASIVYSLLLPCAKRSEQAMSIEDLDTDWSALLEAITTYQTVVGEWLGEEDEELAGTAFWSIPHVALHTVMRFLGSVYWKRLWIAQELILGKAVRLFAGPSTIDLMRINIFSPHVATRQSLQRLESKPEYDKSEKAEEIDGRILENFKSYFFEMSAMRYHRLPHSLISLSRSADATNPLDKVYGILGLLPPEQADMINVDYNRTIEQVFTDFSASMVKHTASLNMLKWWTPSVQRLSLPSWVIDLRTDISMKFSERSYTPRGEWPTFQPTTPRPKVVEGTLHVATILVGLIDGLSTVVTRSAQPVEDEVAQTFAQPSREEAASGTDEIVAPLAIALGSAWHPDRRSCRLPSVLFAKYESQHRRNEDAATVVQFFEQNKNLIVSGQTTLGSLVNMPLSGESETIPDIEEMRTSIKATAGTLYCRRLATSVCGKYGVVPAQARKGDMIYSVHGLDRSFAVLRSRTADPLFEWIGTAQFDGLWNRKDIQDRDDRLQSIVII